MAQHEYQYREGDRWQAQDGKIYILQGNQWVPEAPKAGSTAPAKAEVAPAKAEEGPQGDSALLDALKTAPGALVRGGVGLLTTGHTLADLAARGADWAGHAASNYLPEGMPEKIHQHATALQEAVEPLTYEGAMKQIEHDFGPFHKPTTTAGRIVGGIGEYAPLMFGGEGTLAAKALKAGARAVPSAVGAEAAGQTAQALGVDPKYDAMIRALGGMGGLVGPAALRRAVTPNPLTGAGGALRREQLQTLKGADVGVSASQAVNSPRIAMWEGGGVPSGQGQQMTEAMMKTAGAPGGLATDANLAAARAALNQEKARLNTYGIPWRHTAGDPLYDAIYRTQVSKGVGHPLYDALHKDFFDAQTKLNKGGRIAAPDYQALSKKYGKLAETHPEAAQIKQALDQSMNQAIAGTGDSFADYARRSAALDALEVGAGAKGTRAASGLLDPSKVFQAARGKSPELAKLARAGEAITAPVKPMTPPHGIGGGWPEMIGSIMGGGGPALGTILGGGGHGLEAAGVGLTGSIAGHMMGRTGSNLARRHIAEPLARSPWGQKYLANQAWRPDPFTTMNSQTAAMLLANPNLGAPRLHTVPQITVSPRHYDETPVPGGESVVYPTVPMSQ